MLDSIYIGMTGLQGYSRGLKVIANNTANINTPGFKGSSLQFSDMFYAKGNLSGGTTDLRYGQVGFGLNTHGTTTSFKQGELRQTSSDLDLAVDGQGMFMLKDSDGGIAYTRAGQFEFNNDGALVNKTDLTKVMGRSTDGSLTEISIKGLNTNLAKATATVKLTGNISSTTTTQTVSDIKVFDAAGVQHTLSLKLTKGTAGDDGKQPWVIELLDENASVIASGGISFRDGKITDDSSKLTLVYKPNGVPEMSMQFDFSNTTSYSTGGLSNVSLSSQDGYASGSLTKATFDTTGTLVLSYSNGQTVKGARLALGRFNSAEAITAIGGNQFQVVNNQQWELGVATEGAFGSISAGVVEISNVDLSSEFSDLVVMQRGYQASSQVVSTANEMLQQLFAIRGK